MAERSFADRIASLCLQKYSQIPKKGKPQRGKEWTLLAGIVMSTGLGKSNITLDRLSSQLRMSFKRGHRQKFAKLIEDC